MELAELFKEHFAENIKSYSAAMSETGFDSIVIDAGSAYTYFNDDQHAPFQQNSYFSTWCPVATPHHLIVIEQGNVTPSLIFYFPDDFWHEQKEFDPSYWGEHFSVTVVKSVDAGIQACKPTGRVAYIGENAGLASRLGWSSMPKTLISMLNWARSFKSDYEIACSVEATKIAAKGHLAVAELVPEGASELELHQAYTAACQCVDADLPYGTIIGWDQKSAILHYHGKRQQKGERVLLIDAGASFCNYASDITRTYVRQESNHPVFNSLLDGLNSLQLEICAAAKPGSSFFELTDMAHQGIAKLLLQAKIIKSGSEDELIDTGITKAFFPHGLGHLLGLQVHDVGGDQSDHLGTPCMPPERYPKMRSNRVLSERMLITIEPGLYFIPMLIEGLKDKNSDCDFALIEELVPYGGIRIEDDVLITRGGHRNLTREFLP